MNSIRFDHFITYIDAPSIEGYLEEYRAAGFIPADETVRHDPGLRNGFLFIGREYIELCWVENEDLFNASDPEEHVIRAALRPCSIGMLAEDLQATHDAWVAQGLTVPPIWSKAPRDAAPDAPPEWSFQGLPDDELPGAGCFVLTYHSRADSSYAKGTARIAPNTIYAIDGVTFVATEAGERAKRWRDLLAPDAAIEPRGSSASVLIGPHRATWMTPDDYHASFLRTWTPAPHKYGELAVFHLLASDLGVARDMLERAGRQVIAAPDTESGQERLLVPPDPRDGLFFEVRECPPEEWQRKRMAQTGEQIELVTR